MADKCMWQMLLGCLLMLALGCSLVEASRPNIVFILADDLGWNDVSFHGSKQIPTPNLDALAYDGILLGNYYVQPICTPTRSALMTGRYPIHTGMQHGVIVSAQPYGLGLNETLMPEYLKKLGYSTHIVGKWHMGFYAQEYTPVRRGFDSHFGYFMGCEDYWSHWHGQTGPKSWGLDFRRDMDLVKTDYGKYSTELFAAETVDIINNHDTSKPLYMYLPHQAVHSGNAGTKKPLEAPWKYVQRFSHIKHHGRRMFAAMVSALDDAVGNVTKALHARGMLNNTVIVFSTDNGGPAAGFDVNYANNWPLRGLKSTIWEGGTHGAGFIWSPLLKESGYTSRHLLHVTDWLPTLLHVAGYDMTKLPDNLDGLDLWDMLSEKDQDRRTEFLYNIDPKEPSKAFRMRDMKVIQGKGNTNAYRGWYPPEQVTRPGFDPESILDFDKKDKLGKLAGNGENEISKFDIEDEVDDTWLDRYNELAVDNEKAMTVNKELTESLMESAPSEMFVSDLEPILKSLGRSGKKGEPFVVDCGYKPANYSTNCVPEDGPCLFNITADPCEFNNLADKYPDVLQKLLDRVHAYRQTMVKPRNKPNDPKGLPYYHNGAWVPWRNSTQAEQLEVMDRKLRLFL